MKRITALILSALLTVSLCACTNNGTSGTERFSAASPAVGFGIGLFLSELHGSLYKTGDDLSASAQAEYVYETEDGPQTAHTEVAFAVRGADNAVALTVGGRTFSYDGSLRLDGAPLGYGDMAAIYAEFVKEVASAADGSDIEIAPDSIRSGDDDVEVDRYTLTLDGEKLSKAKTKAALTLDKYKAAITDFFDAYAYMHKLDKTGGQLYDEFCGAVLETFTRKIVWQRYINAGKTGEVLAARFKSGDDVVRYLCAETGSYGELSLYCKLGDIELELGYDRRTDAVSESYKLTVTENGRVTSFDGEIASAYKSGSFKADLRSSKDGVTVRGAQINGKYDGTKTLELICDGSFVSDGVRTPFEFTAAFSKTAVSFPEYVSDPVPLYRAAEVMENVR